VLTCGGVPRSIWEVHSGLIVQGVVLSVRGCLMLLWLSDCEDVLRQICYGGLFRGISILRVNPKSHLIFLFKMFLLKQRKHSIK